MTEKHLALPLRLFGLPGCGTSRLQSLWQAELHREVQALDFAVLAQPQSNTQGFNLLVIDARSFWQLPRDQWLQVIFEALVSQADALVLHFLEAASLEQQMRWQSYLRVFAKPVLLSLNQAVPHSLTTALQSHCGSAVPNLALAEPLQQWEFTLPKVNLEHLLMVLDNAKTALGGRLLRVKGVVQTQEYDNLVRIEGAAYRWDCFAARPEEAESGCNCLIVQGFALDRRWLEQMLCACEA